MSFLFVLGCGENTTPEDTIPPSPPALLSMALPTTVVDTVCRPIDLGGTSNSILIKWRPPSDTDIREWQLFLQPYDTIPQVILAGRYPFNLFNLSYYIQDARITPDPVDGSLRPFKIWMHAVDESGNVSGPSDTVNFALLLKAGGLTVTDTVDGYPQFRWQNPYITSNIAPDRYVVKVFSANQAIVWMWYQVRYDSDQRALFNSDFTADPTYIDVQNRLIDGVYRVRLEYWIANEAGSFAEREFNQVRSNL